MARLTLLALLCLWLAAPSPAYDAIPVVFRGALEAEVRPGRLIPVVVKKRKLGLCLGVAPTVDSHGWRGTLRSGRVVIAVGLEPSPRRSGAVCFESAIAEGLLPLGREHSLCVEVADLVDGTSYRPPCRRFLYRERRPESKGVWNAARAAMAGAGDTVAELDRIAGEARDLGLRFMPIQIELMAVHQLVNSGDAESHRRALARLDDLPVWLSDEAASHWQGQAHLQRARLLEALGDRRRAWSELQAAEAAAQRIASSHWLGITMHQVGLLAGQGDVDRAVSRLRFALEECQLAPCHESLVKHARGQLAWRLPQLADVSDDDLSQAAAMLETAAEEANDDPPEVANHLINLAWVWLRRGDVNDLDRVAATLAKASRVLDAQPASERVDVLRGWADVVSASATLQVPGTGPLSGEEERLAEAAGLCAPLAGAPDLELAAWASGCAARVARMRGDLETAADFFDRALLLHEHLRLGQERARAPMGPGERADLFYRAARVAAEQGDPARGWDVLSRLDALAPDLEARRQCRETAAGEALDAWRGLDREAEDLFARLAALDGPVAGAARFQREAQRRLAKQRLREIFETLPGCRVEATEVSAADVKLFAIDEEVWALRRNAQGIVASHRALGSLDLSATLAAMASARASRTLDDEQWQELTAPLAAVVLPLLGAGEGEGPLQLSLHGVLQQLPVSALPDPDGGYWGLRRTVSHVPAASPISLEGRNSPAPLGAGVIILDPLGDLAGARRLLPYYRELIESPVLLGRAATVAAFEAAATHAGWLHVDSHGRFDAAFPELSGLVLADGVFDLARLARRLHSVPRFVNLSGCRTGAWPQTADSGRYGLAGLFVRRGALWVIASVDDLDNKLAADFNRAFYAALFAAEEGPVEVPEAFRRALVEVAEGHPAASWSNLLLLAAPNVSAHLGGNSSPSPLPLERKQPT